MSKKKNKDNKTAPENADVKIADWSSTAKVKERSFPGPDGVDERFRIAFTRAAFAEITAHAKESTDKEVCGVLVSEICEDERGRYPYAQAAVRGSSVKQGSQHVTYTQETWNAIYKEIDEKYAKMTIVGWYHSHPGFGVQFSDMDKFIQNNFFGGGEQFGFVTDPLGGENAIIANGPNGIENVPRFWVDGREHKCWTPPKEEEETARSGNSVSDKRIEELENRLSQVLHSLDETRNTVHRTVLFGVMLICTLAVFWIGSGIWKATRPPIPEIERENVASFPQPIEINDQLIEMQVKVESVKVPDEINPVLELRKQLTQIETQALIEGKRLALQEFTSQLADASPEEVKEIVAEAKRQVAERRSKGLPVSSSTSGKRARTQVILLWCIIGLILLLIITFIIKSIRRPA